MAILARIRKDVIIDTTTGEVLYERTKTLRMFLFTDEGYMLFHNRGMVKINRDAHWPLSVEDSGRLLALVQQLRPGNVLMEDKTPMNAAMIGKRLGLSRNRTYDFLRRLMAAGMLARQGRVYVVNPVYAFAGKYLSGELYRLFRKDLEPFVPEWAKREYDERGL